MMKAEKHLKGAKIPMRLIPVPRKLRSDCGLAIRIPLPVKDRARQVLAGAGVLPQSVHILLDSGEYGDVPF